MNSSRESTLKCRWNDIRNDFLGFLKDSRRNGLKKFDTYGDAVLLGAVETTADYVADALTASNPRWLTLVGNTGTGKTLLATLAFNYLFRGADNSGLYQRGAIRRANCVKRDANDLSAQWRREKSSYSPDEEKADLFYLDDIGTDVARTDFVRNGMCALLCARARIPYKWTILTSNLSLDGFRELDTRVADRLYREGSAVVVVDCQPHSQRTARQYMDMHARDHAQSESERK